MIKIGVVGLGYLGRHHLNCLEETDFDIAGIYDIDKTLLKERAQTFDLRAFPTFEAMLEEVDAVDIVTDTESHFQLAKLAIVHNKHVFVEKPVTATLDECYQLAALLKEKPDIKFQVGHIERFNPAFLSLKDVQLNPQFIEVHRLANYNERGTDVSVVMDIMIHDLDVLLSMVNSKVTDISAKGVSLFSTSADICNARIKFANGCVANVTASRISLKTMRKIRLFQEDAYISMDFFKKESQVIRLNENSESLDMSIPVETSNGTKYMSVKTNKPINHNALLMELQELHDAIVKDKRPKVGIVAATQAMELANKIEAAMTID